MSRAERRKSRGDCWVLVEMDSSAKSGCESDWLLGNVSTPEGGRHNVSLRGASVREVSRDALLEQVTKERELRSYNRRVAASALFIQVFTSCRLLSSSSSSDES
ncbi:E3 ubiquitin-protein ligase [Nymphaea thermarum]|nr:E3 ubiquitin-protein ligase [Nymphaea thermarum]